MGRLSASQRHPRRGVPGIVRDGLLLVPHHARRFHFNGGQRWPQVVGGAMPAASVGRGLLYHHERHPVVREGRVLHVHVPLHRTHDIPHPRPHTAWCQRGPDPLVHAQGEARDQILTKTQP